jgi:hypothetical protein
MGPADHRRTGARLERDRRTGLACAALDAATARQITFYARLQA